jgi:hypothetical protein
MKRLIIATIAFYSIIGCQMYPRSEVKQNVSMASQTSFEVESFENISTVTSIYIIRHKETGNRYIVTERDGGGSSIIPLADKDK